VRIIFEFLRYVFLTFNLPHLKLLWHINVVKHQFIKSHAENQINTFSISSDFCTKAKM